jgi:hypothetical protein
MGNRRAHHIAARVVAQQVVDGADAEFLVELVGIFTAEDVVQPIAQ